MKNAKLKKGFIALLAATPLLSFGLPILAQTNNDREHDRDRDNTNRNRIIVQENNFHNFRFGTDFRTFDRFFGNRFSTRLTRRQRILLVRFLLSLTVSQRDDLMDLLTSLTPHQKDLLMDFLNSLTRRQRRELVALFFGFRNNHIRDWDRHHRGMHSRTNIPNWFMMEDR